MAQNVSGGGGRSRGRRRRRPRGDVRSGSHPRKSKSGGGKRSARGSRGNAKTRRGAGNKTPQPHAGPAPAAGRYFTGELNEFELFCAYHLRLDRDGKVGKFGMNDIASRFGTDVSAIEQALADFAIDPKQIDSAFDMDLARLDIKVAPPGIDRVELARTIFQDFLDAGCGTGPVPNIPGEPVEAASSETGD